MKKFFLALICAAGLFHVTAAETPTNHVDMTSAVLDFLSRTELCLNTCRDAASVQAALPQLEELRKECENLVNTQRDLPEPTVQDYMAVQNQMEAFNTIWNAICDHIERLELEGLMSDRLRDILRIAPAAH